MRILGVLLLLVASLATAVTIGSSSSSPASAAASRFNGEGWDACDKYSAAKWNTIYANSPRNYRGLGFYLGGKTADDVCPGPFGSTWINNLNSGWRLAPIWDGLQAPSGCGGGYSHRMSSDPSTSYNQGVNSANHAKIVMDNLGLSGIVYLDLEAYSGTNACEAAVGHYAGGFTNRLHALGYRAGVYGSACAPDMDFYATLNNVPNDVWIADYNGIDSAASSGSVSCVSSSHWVNHQRIHQYRGDVSITHGGVTLPDVDKDCYDGDTTGAVEANMTCG